MPARLPHRVAADSAADPAAPPAAALNAAAAPDLHAGPPHAVGSYAVVGCPGHDGDLYDVHVVKGCIGLRILTSVEFLFSNFLEMKVRITTVMTMMMRLKCSLFVYLLSMYFLHYYIC